MDVYQQMHVLWTKYCTELDNTIFVKLLLISGLKKGFICESFSFVVVYLGVGGLTKTLIVPAAFIVNTGRYAPSD